MTIDEKIECRTTNSTYTPIAIGIVGSSVLKIPAYPDRIKATAS